MAVYDVAVTLEAKVAAPVLDNVKASIGVFAAAFEFTFNFKNVPWLLAKEFPTYIPAKLLVPNPYIANGSYKGDPIDPWVEKVLKKYDAVTLEAKVAEVPDKVPVKIPPLKGR